MTVRIQKIRIVPAVIVAFEFEELGAAGVRAGQAQGQHGGFAAGVGEANDFRGGNHAAQTLGCFYFGGSCGREVRTLSHGLRNDFDQFGMSVSLDKRSKRHHEIYVFVAVGIPDASALAALEKNRAR